MVNKNIFKTAIEELYADNRKKGKEKGAMGTPRPRKQMIAIAYSKARKGSM